MKNLNTDTGTAKFALGGQSGSYDHSHASQMGHAAAIRRKAAKELSGVIKPVTPMAPMSNAPAPAAPAPNYKSSLVAAAANQGHTMDHDHVMAAIDTMAAKGHLTPFQAGALKGHNGQLQGPQGAATHAAILTTMMANPRPR